MKEILEKDKCSGCTACLSICPKNAITMKDDKYGFKYPVIDQEKCIDCGLCKKTCPVLNKSTFKEFDIKAYACYNKNQEERLKSSSGGIFILIAKEIIKKNGVVFGACFDNENKVLHSYVETEKELEKFMGSKYVQSNVGNSYKKVKEFLLNDRYVFFTGTPCQIEGLKAYLKKDYDKLYTQDIICHGVPSPLVWEKYKDYRKQKDSSTPVKIEFRNKDFGWKLFNLKFSYRNKSYKMNQNNDLYMQAFLKNTILRDSCYSCSFKKKNRISDITLADYWGIAKIHNNMDDDKGTSLMIINSEKGLELFGLIKKSIVFVETDFEKAIRFNPPMIMCAKKDPNRDAFFENLNKIEFDELVKKYTFKLSLCRKTVNKAKYIIKKIIRK